jgi:hypothetical protein
MSVGSIEPTLQNSILQPSQKTLGPVEKEHSCQLGFGLIFFCGLGL